MANEKGLDKIIKIIGILLIVTLIPIAILAIIYNTNDKFKETTNESLKDAPGIIGEYFGKIPTKDEIDSKINYIADNYLSLEKSVAADKLYILKKDDENTFNNIIKTMRKKSSSKTEDIVSLVRDIELRKDLVVSIYEEIQQEKEELLSDEIKRFETYSEFQAIGEINNRYMDNYNSIDKLIVILKGIKRDKAIDIIFYLDDDTKNKILERIKNSDVVLHDELIALLNNKINEYNELKNKSKLFEVMNTNKASNEIGNENKYNMDDLSIIYLNINPEIASQILSKSSEEFINNLFNSIIDEEQLLGIDDSKTITIMDKLADIELYEERKKELVDIYEKMKPEESAKLIEKMFITDPDLIIDILLSMKKSVVSEILNNIDTRKATDISKRILN